MAHDNSGVSDGVSQRASPRGASLAVVRPNFLEGTFQRPRVTRTKVMVTAVLFCTLSGCDERRPPTAPSHPAAITIENGTVTATAGPCCARGPFTYWMPLTLRETAGVGATISQVTATLTEVSGAATVTQPSAVEVFGAARLPANGMLASATIISTGPLLAVSEMTVRVTFTDDNGNIGSVQTSAGVKIDVTGDWSGPLRIPTQPSADWSLGRAAIVQSGDSLTGELVSRDAVRFPLSGSMSGDWAPFLSIGGMPKGSGGCSVGLTVLEFAFISSRVGRMSGRAGGRCPGTVAGSFELQRSS